MNQNERAEAVWKGTFLKDRVEGLLIVQLWNVGNFYAEVFYNPELNEIANIRGFKNSRLTEPYLSN